MKKITFLVDVDDVLLSCNDYALQKLYEETGIHYPLSDITTWGNTNTPVDERKKFFNTSCFYKTQPVLPGAQKFIHELSKRGEVLIGTAVYPQFMSERCIRIIDLFPEIKPENIIMGSRKDVVHTTIHLDDAIHNILDSKADYPVLFRRPWNASLSGCLSVNTYGEFLTLVDSIIKCMTYKEPESELQTGPKVLCFVAPSGAGKTMIINQLLKDPSFKRVCSYTTRKKRDVESDDDYHFVSKENFKTLLDNHFFFETTVYGEQSYGTAMSDVDHILSQGKHAIAAVDICGCMAMKAVYGSKCQLFYVNRDEEKMLDALLSRNIPQKEKIKRIISIEAEKKNMELCDYIIDNNDSIRNAVNNVMKILEV